MSRMRALHFSAENAHEKDYALAIICPRLISKVHMGLPDNAGQTPLPIAKVACIALINLMNTASYLMTFPMVPWMILHFFGGKKEEVGFYSGVLEGAFHVGAFFGAIFWGWFADKYGRRPALLLGLLGTALSAMAFGLSESFAMALVARFMWGSLNGNVGVAKTALSELCDDTNSAKAFSWLGLNTGMGRVIGPLIGGVLSEPVKKYPQLFGRYPLLVRFPFFLPCLVAAVMTMGCFIFTYFVLEETIHLSKAEAKANRLAKENAKALRLPSDHKAGSEIARSSSARLELAAVQVRDALVETVARLAAGTERKASGTGVGAGKKSRHSVKGTYVIDNTESRSGDSRGVAGKIDDVDESEEDCDEEQALVGSMHDRWPSDRKAIEKNNGYRVDTVVTPSLASASSTSIQSIAGRGHAGAGVDQWDEPTPGEGTPSKNKVLNERGKPKGAATSTDDEALKSEGTLAGMRLLLADRPVATSCAVYAALGLVGLVSNELFPLYVLNDASHGGFTWDSAKVGLCGFASGPVLIIFQAFCYERLVKRLGLISLMRLSLVIFAVLIALTPWQSAALVLPLAWQDVVLVTHNVLVSVTRVTAFICVFVVVANSACPEDRGRVNGLGQAAVSIVRAFGPPLGTAAFAASVSPAATALGWPFNFHAVWYGMGFMALGTLALTYELPQWIDGKRPAWAVSGDDE